MTPHDRRAARARQQAVNTAVEILKRNPRFPAAQVQILNDTKKLMDGLTEEEKRWGTAARLEVVLRQLDIRAVAYLELVENMESQEPFMTVVNTLGNQAWQEYTGYPTEILQPLAGNQQLLAIQQRVGYWIGEGYKRLIPVPLVILPAAIVFPGPAQSSIPRSSSLISSAPPRAFVSYSWDNEPHKEWVRGLARRLREESGVDVTLDRWHLQPGDQLPQFMESAVRETDYVLIVCTPGYRSRSDQRKGGVGYEGDIMTAEVYGSANQRKFIPLLREGEWREAAPSWLSGKVYLDFRGEPYREQSYHTRIRTLHGAVDAAPPIGPRPDFSKTGPSPSLAEPLQGDLGHSFEDRYQSAREMLRSLGADYYRRVDLASVTTLDIPAAVLWEAAQHAQAAAPAAQSNRPWPLVFHFFGQETKRTIHPWGFAAEFAQSADRGGPNYEYVAAQESGSVRVLETEGIMMPRSDVFHYDQSIGTAADALEFAARFFRNVELGEANEISVRLEWGGLKGRHIVAERTRMLPSYGQRTSQTDMVVSEIRFRLADATKDLPAKVEKLLTRVFNQFGMFHPKSEIYERVIEEWKSAQ